MLTALPDRVLFTARVEATMAEADRAGDSLAALSLDLDGFKAVNDRLGHAAEDHVLQAFAEILRQNVRADDTVARLGGDEFVVLMRVARAQASAVARATAVRLIDAACVTVATRPARSPSASASALPCTRSTRRMAISCSGSRIRRRTGPSGTAGTASPFASRRAWRGEQTGAEPAAGAVIVPAVAGRTPVSGGVALLCPVGGAGFAAMVKATDLTALAGAQSSCFAVGSLVPQVGAAIDLTTRGSSPSLFDELYAMKRIRRVSGGAL